MILSGFPSPLRSRPRFAGFVVFLSASAGAAAAASPLDNLFFGFPPGLPGDFGVGPFGNLIQHRPPTAAALRGGDHTVVEDDDKILVTMDVAGFSEAEIAVSVESNLLKVAGTHACEHPGICLDRSFSRGFDLRSASIDLGKIRARRSVDGVMSITLPKAGRGGKRVIPVALELHIEPAKAGEAGPTEAPGPNAAAGRLPQEQVAEIEGRIAVAQAGGGGPVPGNPL